MVICWFISVLLDKLIYKNIKILYEDDNIIIIQKPKALLTIPFLEFRKSTFSLLLCISKAKLMLLQRLDFGTWGLILVCKTWYCDLQYLQLKYQFYHKLIVKVYICVCIDANHINDLRFCLFKELVKILVNNRKINIILINLLSGKRHQIRLHQRCIIGDRIYGFNMILPKIWNVLNQVLKHQCLNAYLLCFRNPVNFKIYCFEYKMDKIIRYMLINFLIYSNMKIS
ncbi:MAG: pseudouridine synthase [Candidatus Hodgkinia cicadicola]